MATSSRHILRYHGLGWYLRLSERAGTSPWHVRLIETMSQYHVWWTTIIYAALISLANYVAFWLRFDGTIPAAEEQNFLRLLPALWAISAIAFIALGLHRGMWRYTSIWDLRDLVG